MVDVADMGFLTSRELYNFGVDNRDAMGNSSRFNGAIYTTISDTICVTTGAVARVVNSGTSVGRTSNGLCFEMRGPYSTDIGILLKLRLRLARLSGRCDGGVVVLRIRGGIGSWRPIVHSWGKY